MVRPANQSAPLVAVNKGITPPLVTVVGNDHHGPHNASRHGLQVQGCTSVVTKVRHQMCRIIRSTATVDVARVPDWLSASDCLSIFAQKGPAHGNPQPADAALHPDPAAARLPAKTVNSPPVGTLLQSKGAPDELSSLT